MRRVCELLLCTSLTSALETATPLSNRPAEQKADKIYGGNPDSSDIYRECEVALSSNEMIRDVQCMERVDIAHNLTHTKIYPGSVDNFEKCDVHFCNATTENYRELYPDTHKGHLQFFGQQGQKTVEADEYGFGKCPSAAKFLKEYTHTHTPVVMRGCASHFPSVQKWHDIEYLRNITSKSWKPIIETQKIITRNDRGPFAEGATFHDFLDLAPEKGWYLVNSLSALDESRALRQDTYMPKQMQCRRTLQTFEGVHMWMSFGGTQSSQHFDTHDNLQVQVSGTKTIYMTDPTESKELYMDFHDKFGLAPINVQKVDLNIFPAVKNVTVVKATINPGDILYIPSHWWHIVVSHDAEPGKEKVPNIAITNEWWSWKDTMDRSLSFFEQPSTQCQTAVEVAKFAETWRNHPGTNAMTAEELCGGEDRKGGDIISSEVPSMMEEGEWWHRGLPYIKSTDDFFNKWLVPRVNGAQLKTDNSFLGYMCPYVFLFWFKEEKQGWLLSLKRQAPKNGQLAKWPRLNKISGAKYKKLKRGLLSKFGSSTSVMEFVNKAKFLDLIQDWSDEKGGILYRGTFEVTMRGQKIATLSHPDIFADMPRCLGMLDLIAHDTYGETILQDALFGSQSQQVPESLHEKWVSGESRRCDLEQVDGGALTPTQFASKYADKPVVVYNVTNNWPAYEKWTRENFVKFYGHHTVPPVMATDMPPKTASGDVLVSDFIANTRYEHAVIYNYGDTTKNGIGESKLLFDTATDMVIPDLFVGASRDTTLSMGGGQGVSHQRHQVAWLNLVHGKKHWFVSPPNFPRPDPPSCDHAADLRQPPGKILQCVQQPGEVLWLPDNWWHATCNIDEWTIGQGAQAWVDIPSQHEWDLPEGLKEAPKLGVWSALLEKYGPIPHDVRMALQYGRQNDTFGAWLEETLEKSKAELKAKIDHPGQDEL